ncbi:Geraniol 8-hydroxylase [Glycine soja]|uniref:Geraniol 8-hydroxylase n=2 Tax=Glycine soja TaxID=3848 RepID=A0A445IY78_GLYSO|nr:Geraniol 8-hydroxylase [Glycine soja]
MVHALLGSFLAMATKANHKLPLGPSRVLIIGKAEELKDLVTNIIKLVGTPNLVDFFPVLKMVDPQSIKRRQSKNSKKVLDMFNHLVSQRLKQREDGKVHNDMLDAMLYISNDNKYMDNMIEHLSHDIFVAGTDTTTSTLEWAMTELVRNPDVMSKAKQELEQMISKGNNPIEEADIGKLPYLQAIVKETLRLHPPVPFLLPPKAGKDVDIGGHTISKDAKVLVNMWTICKDPTLWDSSNYTSHVVASKSLQLAQTSLFF